MREITDHEWTRMGWRQRQTYLATLDQRRHILALAVEEHEEEVRQIERQRLALDPDPDALAHWDALAEAIGAAGTPHPHEIRPAA